MKTIKTSFGPGVRGASQMVSGSNSAIKPTWDLMSNSMASVGDNIKQMLL